MSNDDIMATNDDGCSRWEGEAEGELEERPPPALAGSAPPPALPTLVVDVKGRERHAGGQQAEPMENKWCKVANMPAHKYGVMTTMTMTMTVAATVWSRSDEVERSERPGWQLSWLQSGPLPWWGWNRCRTHPPH